MQKSGRKQTGKNSRKKSKIFPFHLRSRRKCDNIIMFIRLFLPGSNLLRKA
nr:MAG TPA: hypothetical protein [Caudoviricetes sp.]